jgi:cytochrome c556
MLPFVFVALLAMARSAAPQAASTAQAAPVLENVELMDLMIKPAYDALRHAMAVPPADRKGWADIYQQAARLAELENLLFLRTRSGEARRNEWASDAARARDASAGLASAAALGLRSAEPADFERLRAAFPAISEACTACHRAFAREAPVIKP